MPPLRRLTRGFSSRGTRLRYRHVEPILVWFGLKNLFASRVRREGVETICRLRAPGPEVIGASGRLEQDDVIGHLWRMRRETGATSIAPARKLHHHARLRAAFAWLGRLDDDQPTAIEEEGGIAKQSTELSHYRMIVRHRLRLELAQGAFDHL